MSDNAAVPDSWDDDWVNMADKPESQTPPPQPARQSKSEIRAKHLELNRRIWDSADNPGRNHWLEAKGVAPLAQDFKPPVMQVLTRKPPTSIARRDGADSVANPNLADGDDSEEEARKKREASFEERQRKTKLEREEKQRKYAEARERIMGSPNPGSPVSGSRESSQGREGRRPRAKADGGAKARATSSADQSPIRVINNEKTLFDPCDTGRRPGKRESETVPKPDEPMRQPRGPDSYGRGGFGFAGRGGRAPA